MAAYGHYTLLSAFLPFPHLTPSHPVPSQPALTRCNEQEPWHESEGKCFKYMKL